jgi:hypothetical protein
MVHPSGRVSHTNLIEIHAIIGLPLVFPGVQ